MVQVGSLRVGLRIGSCRGVVHGRTKPPVQPRVPAANPLQRSAPAKIDSARQYEVYLANGFVNELWWRARRDLSKWFFTWTNFFKVGGGVAVMVWVTKCYRDARVVAETKAREEFDSKIINIMATAKKEADIENKKYYDLTKEENHQRNLLWQKEMNETQLRWEEEMDERRLRQEEEEVESELVLQMREVAWKEENVRRDARLRDDSIALENRRRDNENR